MTAKRLTPGTVSAVLNNTKAARTIPENTRKRIREAARQLNYQPNFLARSLRVRRTYTVGVIVEEIGDPYGGSIVNGIEPFLRDNNFFFLTVAHRHDPKLLDTYSHLLAARGAEGIITIDTSIVEEPALPTVAEAPVRKPLPAGMHEIYGTIRSVDGSMITIATRDGTMLKVDATDAMRHHNCAAPKVGRAMMARGVYETGGVLRAQNGFHAKPSPVIWMADR